MNGDIYILATVEVAGDKHHRHERKYGLGRFSKPGDFHTPEFLHYAYSLRNLARLVASDGGMSHPDQITTIPAPRLIIEKGIFHKPVTAKEIKRFYSAYQTVRAEIIHFFDVGEDLTDRVNNQPVASKAVTSPRHT